MLPDLDDTTRAELTDSHRHLLAPLDTALRDAGVKRAGGPSRRVRRQVLAAVRRLLPSPT